VVLDHGRGDRDLRQLVDVDRHDVALEDGQIKEIGSHDELLGRDGAYASLYQMQFKTNLQI